MAAELPSSTSGVGPIQDDAVPHQRAGTSGAQGLSKARGQAPSVLAHSHSFPGGLQRGLWGGFKRPKFVLSSKRILQGMLPYLLAACIFPLMMWIANAFNHADDGTRSRRLRAREARGPAVDKPCVRTGTAASELGDSRPPA